MSEMCPTDGSGRIADTSSFRQKSEILAGQNTLLDDLDGSDGCAAENGSSDPGLAQPISPGAPFATKGDGPKMCWKRGASKEIQARLCDACQRQDDEEG